jgi:hypothetical protein
MLVYNDGTMKSLDDRVTRFAENALAGARVRINGVLHESILKRATRSLSVYETRHVEPRADWINAILQTRADALLEATELYGPPLDELSAGAILRDISDTRARLVGQVIDQLKPEFESFSKMMSGKLRPATTWNDLFESEVVEYTDKFNYLTDSRINEIKLQIERQRYASKQEPTSVSNIHYHLIGNNSRVNNSSLDQSLNVINISPDQLFVNIRNRIMGTSFEGGQQAQLLERLDNLEKAQNHPSFVQKYTEFIGAAADHMTLIAPFLPALAEIMQKVIT